MAVLTDFAPWEYGTSALFSVSATSFSFDHINQDFSTFVASQSIAVSGSGSLGVYSDVLLVHIDSEPKEHDILVVSPVGDLFDIYYSQSQELLYISVLGQSATQVAFSSLANYAYTFNIDSGGNATLVVKVSGVDYTVSGTNALYANSSSLKWEVYSNGDRITASSVVISDSIVDFPAVPVVDTQPSVTTEIAQGDPKIFVTGDGMDLMFVDGLPIMDDGLENIVTISLGTKKGFALNKIASNGAEAVGSAFIEESLKSITVEQIRILEDAAEKSMSWAVSDGLIAKTTASVSAGERGYELTIVITPPTGEDRILVYTKNGENWVNQKR